jgi:hypothetical protein
MQRTGIVHKDEILKADLFSEILLIGAGVAGLLSFALVVVTALIAGSAGWQ